MEKPIEISAFFVKILLLYFVNIFTISYKGEYFMIRHKYTLEKNGDYSILCINYQNGTIFKMKQFSPKNDIEVAKICFLLNQHKCFF